MKKHKLYIDKDGLNQSLKNKEKEQNRINEFLPIVLKFFDNKITDQEIRNFKNYNQVVDSFRLEFPHPHAKDELNFELLGKDTRGLKDACSVLRLVSDEYDIKDGKVSLRSEWITANTEQHTRYTKDEHEVKAFEYAQKLAKIMSAGVIDGYVSRSMIAGFNNGLDLFFLNEGGTVEMRGGRILDASDRAKATAMRNAKASKIQ